MIIPIILHHDSSKEYTKQLDNNLSGVKRFVYNSSAGNTSFTHSFNYCLESTKPFYEYLDYIMICNNDIDLTDNQVELLDNILDGRVGIFSPVVNSPHNAVMSKIGDDQMRQVPWVEFVCPIIHKDVIETIGMLDRKMPRGWGVELDYCYRAKQAGFSTYLIQDVSVHHYGHKSQSDHAEYSHYANIEMNDRLREKYGDNWQEVLKYPQW
jgi:GT2 family glycosyltransferase